jgi:arylsulfatase A-like enzyme
MTKRLTSFNVDQLSYSKFMRKRDFNNLYFLPVVLFALLACISIQQSCFAAEVARPNIILIMGDDMGFSDIQPYGGEIATPTLQRLADSGLRFTQFYNTARCCPTRASLLTGLYPHQAGVGHMMDDRGHPGYQGELNNNCVTIAEALKPAGYSTYMAGKWHVTPHVNPNGPHNNWPRQRGFDRFYGTIHGAGSFFDPNSLTRDNKQISPAADPEYKPETYYYTDAISDHAVRFIDEHFETSTAKEQTEEERPFFMYVAYTAAHWPMHALPEDIQKYEDKYEEGYRPVREARLERLKEMGLVDPKTKLPADAEEWSKVEHREWETACMQVYAAMVDNMDQGIGRIVGKLEDLKQLDNTLIFFLQDNGGCAEGLGRRARGGLDERPDQPLAAMKPDELQTSMIPAKARDGYPVVMGPKVMPGPADTYIAYGRGWANVSNTPFREYKHWVHEGGISTPLIAHWPAGIGRAGELDRQPGHLIDIMATCLDVAKADYPSKVGENSITPLPGKSLVPAFKGEDIDREAIYWEHEGNRAVRVGDWKLVAKENQPWELYDIAADRIEANDLTSKMPAKVKELSKLWDQWAARSQVLPLGTWRGQRKEISEHDQWSDKVKFELSADDHLPQAEAPAVHGKSFGIQAHISKWSGDGVLVAQGGSSHGYVLYLKKGILHFAVRSGGKLSLVSSKSVLSNSKVIDVNIRKNGQVKLLGDGEQVGSGKLEKTLSTMPLDGLQVGRDEAGQVGDYKNEFPYQGDIDSVTIEIEQQKKK